MTYNFSLLGLPKQSKKEYPKDLQELVRKATKQK